MQIKTLFSKARKALSGDPLSYFGTSPAKVVPSFITSAKGGSIGQTLEDVLFFKTLRQKLGDFDGVLDPYLENPWVYASITKIAENLAHTPRKLVRRSEKDKTTIESHKVLDLLKEPNQFLSGNQLFLGTLVYLESQGEAFWVMRRDNATQIPESIFLYDPRRFHPVFTKDKKTLIGWSYRTHDGQIIPLNLWEVAHFKLFNPNDQVRGLPRWVSAGSGIDQNYWVNRFSSNFFKDDNLLSGFVDYKGELTDPQYKRLYQQLNKPEATGDAATRIVILEGEQEKKFTSVPIQNHQKEISDIKKLSRTEVFAVYNTNEVVLGINEEVKSDQGSKTAHKTWWTECLIPTANDLQDVIYSQFLKFIESGNLYLEWDLSKVEALQEDFEKKLEKAQKMLKLGYTLNQINQKLELGMEDVDWGDVAYKERTLVPIFGDEEIISFIVSQDSTPALPSGSPEDNDEKQLVPIQRAKYIIPSKDQVLAVAKDVLTRQDDSEKKFASKYKRFLMEIRSETISNLRAVKNAKEISTKGIEEFVFDVNDAQARYSKIMLPAYVDGVKNGIISVDIELQLIASAEEFVITPEMEVALNKFLLSRVDEMSPKIIETIREGLVATLREGILENETVAELTTRVRSVMNETAVQGLRIARTESGAVINGGRFLEMQNQKVGFTQWSTAGDSAVRDTHASVDGEIVKIGELFPNGLRFPNDPLGAAAEVINCRCVALAIQKKEN